MEFLQGIHTAHIWRSDDETPNALLPRINNKGTIKPIKGPAIYHGHGCFKISSIFYLFSSHKIEELIFYHKIRIFRI